MIQGWKSDGFSLYIPLPIPSSATTPMFPFCQTQYVTVPSFSHTANFAYRLASYSVDSHLLILPRQTCLHLAVIYLALHAVFYTFENFQTKIFFIRSSPISLPFAGTACQSLSKTRSRSFQIYRKQLNQTAFHSAVHQNTKLITFVISHFPPHTIQIFFHPPKIRRYPSFAILFVRKPAVQDQVAFIFCVPPHPHHFW